MKHFYLNLDLVQLSAQSIAAHLDNQFILIDNFDELQMDTEAFFVNHPLKLSFTVMLFCLDGWMRFQINLRDFELQANDVLIVQEGAIGEYRGMSDGARIVVIAFASEYFQVANRIDATMSLRQLLRVSPLCHLRPETIEESLTIYRLMKSKIAETDNPFRKESLFGYTQVLTANVYNYLLMPDSGTEFPKKIGRHQEIFNQFIKEVQQNYTKERSVSYYADVLCVTPKYLSQVVRKVSGRLAGDWITDFVVLEAKALLKSRKYTIQQVANMLNFANQSFFGKYFKEKVGYSPTEYQKM